MTHPLPLATDVTEAQLGSFFCSITQAIQLQPPHSPFLYGIATFVMTDAKFQFERPRYSTDWSKLDPNQQQRNLRAPQTDILIERPVKRHLVPHLCRTYSQLESWITLQRTCSALNMRCYDLQFANEALKTPTMLVISRQEPLDYLRRYMPTVMMEEDASLIQTRPYRTINSISPAPSNTR